MPDDSKRPLFRRFQNREAVNMRASEGKQYNTGPQQQNFNGVLALNNPLGTYWPDFAQAGALVLSEGDDAEVGGSDYVKITADGNTITVPGSWKQMGSTAIDTTASAVNHIIVTKTIGGIIYAVSVE